MPYRASAKPREPQSPDVDVNLLRKPWCSQSFALAISAS
jgi:hypothetical protein